MRHAVRALFLDEDDRLLLCRLEWPGTPTIWAAPGGGIEPGEDPMTALRREIDEEIGFPIGEAPPHVWRQTAIGPRWAAGYDGVVNDYFVVRTTKFEPRGSMSDAELAAEGVVGTRWWSLDEIARYRGPWLFSPRDLATPLGALLRALPETPIALGV